jgi:tellurite resistance protein TehA-like permease
MRLRGPFWGALTGATLWLAGILWIRYVQRAWEHTTFHPDMETQGPALLVLVGLAVLTVSLIIAAIGAITGLSRRRTERHPHP